MGVQKLILDCLPQPVQPAHVLAWRRRPHRQPPAGGHQSADVLRHRQGLAGGQHHHHLICPRLAVWAAALAATNAPAPGLVLPADILPRNVLPASDHVRAESAEVRRSAVRQPAARRRDTPRGADSPQGSVHRTLSSVDVAAGRCPIVRKLARRPAEVQGAAARGSRI